jgi:hypothetical protein
MRDGAFDRNWTISGYYEWFGGTENYTFHVQDPDPSPSHVNVVWESNGETYRSDPIPSGWRFDSIPPRTASSMSMSISKLQVAKKVWIS